MVLNRCLSLYSSLYLILGLRVENSSCFRSYLYRNIEHYNFKVPLYVQYLWPHFCIQFYETTILEFLKKNSEDFLAYKLDKHLIPINFTRVVSVPSAFLRNMSVLLIMQTVT